MNMGHVGSKSRSLGRILDILIYTLEATFLFQYFLSLLRMFALIIYWMGLNMDHMGSKSRSLGEILDNPCCFAPLLCL